MCCRVKAPEEWGKGPPTKSRGASTAMAAAAITSDHRRSSAPNLRDDTSLLCTASIQRTPHTTWHIGRTLRSGTAVHLRPQKRLALSCALPICQRQKLEGRTSIVFRRLAPSQICDDRHAGTLPAPATRSACVRPYTQGEEKPWRGPFSASHPRPDP
jgi:hypothetical protein